MKLVLMPNINVKFIFHMFISLLLLVRVFYFMLLLSSANLSK